MWCPSCRADVAAELSTDNRRLMCTRCQSELGIAAGLLPVPAVSQRTVEMERDARDLLARWSAQSLLEVPKSGNQASKTQSVSETPIKKPELRFDRAQGSAPAPSTAFLTAMKDTAPSIVFPIERHDADESVQQLVVTNIQANRLDIDAQPTDSNIDVTNLEVPQTSSFNSPRPQNSEQPGSTVHHHAAHDLPKSHVPVRAHWTTALGQLCAYSGVGLLTCGSVLAMWSYFGGPPSYMPTGWIAAAFGQMLLLLGIVTLISNGLDMTAKEVAWRIDHLAEEIHHMGLALDDLEEEHRHARLQQSQSAREESEQSHTREAA